MTGRERVLKAIHHEEPDRVPLDLGGARSCGISVKAYKNLLDYLGLEVDEIKISNRTGQLALIDEVALEKLGVDVRAVGLNKPSSWQLDVKQDENYFFFLDEWQREWKMPKVDGHYYDIMGFPLAKVDLEEYEWPDPMDPSRFLGLREQALMLKEKTSAAIVASDCLANGFLQMGAQLFGYDNWFLLLASEPKKVERFLESLLTFKMRFWEAFLAQLGDVVDVICEADDLGTQRGPWISKEMFRKYIKPYQAKLFSFIKKKAPVKVFLHSCGSIYDTIPDLIEAGVDILNPIQVSGANMDTGRLKREFGRDLTFWGGGVDTQRALPYGSPKEVKEEVKKRIHDLAPGGGFVFATVHNIQSDVPPENIAAMLEALQLYGKY